MFSHFPHTACYYASWVTTSEPVQLLRTMTSAASLMQAITPHSRAPPLSCSFSTQHHAICILA